MRRNIRTEQTAIAIQEEAKRVEFCREELEKALIDPNEEVKADPVLLEIKQRDDFLRLLTLGNFSALIGKAKARKSTLACMILGTLAGGAKYMNLVPRIKGKCVLFDTEQGRYDVNVFAKRAVDIAGSDENLTIFSLRPYNTEQRITLIEAVLYADDWKFAIIDGVRDLVTDINNPDQATRISDLLLKWSAERNCHIMNIIHQNKADQNARGHIGSEIVNKSETVISIEQSPTDKWVSNVKAEFMRGLWFDDFEITLKDNRPVLNEDEDCPF